MLMQGNLGQDSVPRQQRAPRIWVRVARPISFALTGLAAGGLLLVWPTALGLVNGPGWRGVAALLLALAAFPLGALLGPPLGIMLLALRERWWLARHSSAALRAPGVPGLAIVPTSDDVLVLDPFDRHSLGGREDVALQPFRLPRRRWPEGVLLSATGCSTMTIPARFEHERVQEFASRHGIRVRRMLTDPAAVPPPHKRAYRDLRRYGGHVVRALSPHWLRLAWLPVLVAACSATAVVLGVVSVSGHRIPLLLTGGGGLITVGFGYWHALLTTTHEFQHPEDLPELG